MTKMFLWGLWGLLISFATYYYGVALPRLISADSDFLVAVGFVSFLPATYLFVTEAKTLLARFNKEDDKKFNNDETNKE